MTDTIKITIGTPKQIAWAQSIAADDAGLARQMLAHYEAKMAASPAPEDLKAKVAGVLAEAKAQAAFWIDTRDVRPTSDGHIGRAWYRVAEKVAMTGKPHKVVDGTGAVRGVLGA